jgi:hypothetical protein
VQQHMPDLPKAQHLDRHDKSRLVKSLRAQRLMFEITYEHLPPAELEISGVLGAWSVKDIIAHVMVWERRGAFWLEEAACGKTPNIPLAGHTWNDLDALNAAIHEEFLKVPLVDINAAFAASFEQLMAVVEAISEADFSRTFTYFDGQKMAEQSIAGLVRWRYRHYMEHGRHIEAWAAQRR